MTHPLKDMIARREAGDNVGIASYCTGNTLVLEEALIRAKLTQHTVLIEATPNQVNQFGGYTGMTPADFKNMVLDLAEKVGTPKDLIILGGDHLGPLVWRDTPEAEAMENAKKLVYDFTYAGYQKLHLDTSMRVADDPEILPTETIAKRGVILYCECMKAFSKYKDEHPEAIKPVFIIGSEVPIPGGATDIKDTLAVTNPADFENTIAAYTSAFAEAGIPDAMDDVIGIVVQPGVEHGDSQVFYYNSEAAKDLTSALAKHDGIIFEGHTTDYQSSQCLKDMCRDGIAILKVGPSLTNAYREALFILAEIENELIDEAHRSNLIDICDEVMLADPSNWKDHYHGSEKELHLARKYSYSNRIRYYMGDEKIVAAIDKLFANLREHEIPMNMLHQFMPIQYQQIVDGNLTLDPKDLVMAQIAEVMKIYESATF